MKQTFTVILDIDPGDFELSDAPDMIRETLEIDGGFEVVSVEPKTGSTSV